MAAITQQQAEMIGPPITIYHDPEFKERDWDVEVCMPIGGSAITANERLTVGHLPGAETMACVVHTGPFTTISQAYDALGRWIDAHGYRINGPARELNLRVAEPPDNQNDPNTVCEIQFPVTRI
jgi:effector-binding domain-containing protein